MNSGPGFVDSKFAESSNVCSDLRALADLDVRIGTLVTDSRMVKSGDTFVAYAGEKYDARKFIPQAIAAGANAVLWESQDFVWDPTWQVPNLPLAGLRSKAGIIADHIYGHPSQKLWLIGITGTNGKTSCSHWIAQAMTALGEKTAVIGTLGSGFPGNDLKLSANTTPDAAWLHREMADFLKHGVQCVAMEVSSHGIAQDRISGLAFAVALFTNLSRDHLDYHGSMEAYAAAKAQLFRSPGLKYAVLNLDDAYGMNLSHQLAGMNTTVIGYGFTEPAPGMRDSEKFRIVRGRNLKASPQGLEFDIEFEAEHSVVKTDVVGRFNASNFLGVTATLLASGVKLVDATRVLQQVRPVAGRMEQIGGGDQPLVVVDYAHTPDALEKVLVTLREVLRAGSEANTKPQTGNPKLMCVFGCGGERDRGKRPLLGAVATRLADEVIITSDNPRKEDPHVIIGEIAAGAGTNYLIEEDRATAIFRAIKSVHKGDVVLIAGKGHETYQEIDGEKLPFDDSEVARRALQSLMDKASMQT